MTVDKIVNNIEGITLLSVDDYKEFKKNIPNINDYWWLRSPYADSGHCAALVNDNGDVDYYYVDLGYAARPALYISNPESVDMEIGDKFDFGGHSWTIISDNYALCDESIGRYVFRHDWRAENADTYEASDIKAFIEDWYEKALEQTQNHENEPYVTEAYVAFARKIVEAGYAIYEEKEFSELEISDKVLDTITDRVLTELSIVKESDFYEILAKDGNEVSDAVYHQIEVMDLEIEEFLENEETDKEL